MSVPQIVVVVTRTTASPTPGRGRGTDSTRMSPGPWKTVARIVSVTRVWVGRVSVTTVMSCLLNGPVTTGPSDLPGHVLQTAGR